MPPDLIVFGEDWGRHPSSTQHLVKRLAQNRRVLYINSIGLRRPRLSARDFARALAKVAAAVIGRRRRAPDTALVPDESQDPPGLTILAPLVIPWPGNRLAAWVNRLIFVPRIHRAANRLGIVDPVVWAALPTAIDYAGHLGERAFVYYCGDDFGALTGVDHAPVLACEARLAAHAAHIFAASPALAAKFPPAKTSLLPHGADIALFSRPAEPADDLPQGPVAGFYGSISAWFDQDLYAQLARSLPDWTFLLIGPVLVPVDRLAACPNIRFLGTRPHASLPRYAQHWTAALLPFVDNAQIRASNPLKLREYLAAGRPIVTVDFPALAPYRAHVTIATTPDDWVVALRKAEAEADEGAKLARRTCVAQETWEARAADAAERIDRL